MPSSDSTGTKIVSTFMIGGGAILVGLSLAADALGIGDLRGFGLRELTILGAGLAVGFGGFAVHAPRRAWLARSWTAAPALGPGACLLVALWFGMLVGFIEVAHQSAKESWSDTVMGVSDEYFWHVPFWYVVFFALPGIAGAAVLAIWHKSITLPIAVFAFTTLAAWSQFLVYTGVDTSAGLLLSAGIGIQVARTAAKRAKGFLRLVRLTAPLLGAAVLLGAVGMPWWKSISEQRLLASLPPARADAPNVLLIVLDTVRTDSLALYGYERDTAPTLDALAAQGVTFDFAMSTSPWTLPSHGTMFTGQYRHDLSTAFLGALDDTHRTLAEVFTGQGYATAGFVGNIGYCCRARGLARGFAHYEDFYFDPSVTVMSTTLGQHMLGSALLQEAARHNRNDAETVTTRFLAWQKEQDRPFFAFLNYFDAHGQYLPPKEFAKFGPLVDYLDQWSPRTQRWTDEHIRGFLDAYDACILYIDHHINRIVEHLRATGELDNTLIVVTGDHGEHFGEHGILGHANTLYRPLLQAPLVFRYPGHVPENRRVTELVSLRDLPSTILDVAGIHSETPFPGQSLSPLWSGTHHTEIGLSPAISELRPRVGTIPEWWPTARGAMKALTEGGMHYIVNGDGSEELFDLVDDPHEKVDLIDTEAGKSTAARMRKRLDQLLERP